jgi:hypothetical protein
MKINLFMLDGDRCPRHWCHKEKSRFCWECIANGIVEENGGADAL